MKSNPFFIRFISRTAAVCTAGAGVLAICLGGLVLAGWALDIAALKSILPGRVSVKPNTALAFVS